MGEIYLSMDEYSRLKESEEFYKKNIEFEKTIALISSRFISMSGNMENSILMGLGDMGRLSHADRAYVFLFKENMNLMDNTHEWCRRGVSSQKKNLQDIPSSTVPWWMKKLEKNEIIHVRDVSALPADASSEKEILEMQKVKSLVVLPLYTDGKLIGFIGIDNIVDSKVWSYKDFMLLKLVAEIFSNAFSRMYFEEKLKDSNAKLHIQLNEIKKLQSQIIHQEKMASIGQFAAGIAHEINNPLGFITSNLQTLEKYMGKITPLLSQVERQLKIPDIGSAGDCSDILRYWDEYKIKFILEDVNELVGESLLGLDRISKIVTSLNNFSRPAINEHMTRSNINDILSEILLIIKGKISPDIAIVKESGEIKDICCHSNEISQAFFNIVANSIYALDASSESAHKKLIFKTYESNGFICCEISDTGTGIPAEFMNKIFDPFFTTKDVGEGSGLGLSITYDIIVNRHNGTIHAKSNPNGLTTFKVSLPVQKENIDCSCTGQS